MLVLSRRVGESIVINDDIRVTVIEVKGGKMRLGITAPEEVRIDRQEIHERRREFFEPTVTAASPQTSEV